MSETDRRKREIKLEENGKKEWKKYEIEVEAGRTEREGNKEEERETDREQEREEGKGEKLGR